ncbi:pyrroloquinoline quinone biosynthesis protein PqqB [Streptomyces sp. SP17BM10]|uniref:pyrroloquinoline quinone biosynthesis protein PqqB n=1 Tax=Streptomyces sp. SP17BM10 TaxID=3002530 RepID=UPI002E77A6E5|nr:pyrroloquinoline quinone biosynthesis protein PqqB [Streptomyces sp. SP17BM10]MEE1788235.1 pyrroloquinoline quinone biosynthesis protein PqqB [Streptomyces sp. SP17BM10]
MRIRVLGTAAGGGLPQWNCGCAECAAARRTGHARSQDCLAVSGDGRAWYLVNASPDLRTQLLAAPELAPVPGTRDTPLRGVLLTSGELDHTLGLLTLREAAGLTVHATAPVRRALHEAFPVGPLLAAYTRADWHTVTPGEPVELAGGLRAEPFALGGKRPRYAAGLPDHADWVTGYRFTEDGGCARAVYAPGLADWTPAVDRAVAGADLVLLDGTFATADELAKRTGGARRSPGMGHLAVRDSLPHLARRPGPRYLYTHLNNTNPLAGHSPPGTADLAAAGAAIAEDGTLHEL